MRASVGRALLSSPHSGHNNDDTHDELMASMVLAVASLAMPGHVATNDAFKVGGGSMMAGGGRGVTGAIASGAGALAIPSARERRA